MDYYFDVIKSSFVFFGADDETVRAVLKECGYKIKGFRKGEILLMSGDNAENIGIVLQGSVYAEKSTISGRNFIVTHIVAGGIFGDVLAGSHAASPVTVIAKSDCAVLFLPFHALMNKGAFINGSHIVLQNLISAIADKYFALDARIDLLLEKNLRARIYAYIKEKAAKNGNFSHSLTRQQLADYLGCERAALCRELSRMKHERLIDYDKRKFVLL